MAAEMPLDNGTPVTEAESGPLNSAEVRQPETETTTEITETAAPESTSHTLNLADLKPKQELRGTIKRVELFGAFVDVGAGQDALLHISQISEEPVKNVNDVLKAGDEITLWVRKIDLEQNRLDLTMIRPLGLMWSEIRTGQVLTGTVARIERFGVFVELGAERPGMIHVSELSNGYVASPEEVVKVGDEVQVKVIKVNSRKKQIDLSIKALEMPMVKEQQSEDDEKVPTAIELALRRAMQGSEDEFPALEKVLASADAAQASGKKSKGKRDKRSADNKRRQQQEEILSRTLGNREPTRGASTN